MRGQTTTSRRLDPAQKLKRHLQPKRPIQDAELDAQRRDDQTNAGLPHHKPKRADAFDRQAADLKQQTAELAKSVEALHHTESELRERTEWALRLEKESGELAQQLALFRASRWVKLGRKFGLGPVSPAS